MRMGARLILFVDLYRITIYYNPLLLPTLDFQYLKEPMWQGTSIDVRSRRFATGERKFSNLDAWIGKLILRPCEPY